MVEFELGLVRLTFVWFVLDEFGLVWLNSVWLGWKIIRKVLFTLREDDPDENKKVLS